MIALGSFDGPGVSLAAPRRCRPTPGQAQRCRNLLWLRAVEVGMFDAAVDRVRIHTVAELAALWGLTPQAIRNGIAAARALRDAIAHAG